MFARTVKPRVSILKAARIRRERRKNLIAYIQLAILTIIVFGSTGFAAYMNDRVLMLGAGIIGSIGLFAFAVLHAE